MRYKLTSISTTKGRGVRPITNDYDVAWPSVGHKVANLTSFKALFSTLLGGFWPEFALPDKEKYHS